MGFATDSPTRVDFVFGKHFAHCVFVAYVVLIKFNLSADYLFYAFYSLGFAVVKIVDDDHVVPRADKFYRGMAADISGAARNQYGFHNIRKPPLFQYYVYMNFFAFMQHETTLSL